MRTRLLIILGGCLLALCSDAQILVYKGNVVDKRQGGGAESRHTYRALLIVDASSGATRKINYYQTQGGFYEVEPERAFTTNSISLSNGRTQLVLTSLQAGSETTPGSAIFAKGTKARLPVASNAAASIPSGLDWSLRSIGPDSAGVSRSREETGTFVYHQPFTTAINNKGEDLTEAEMDLRVRLEQAGYRRIEIQ